MGFLKKITKNKNKQKHANIIENKQSKLLKNILFKIQLIINYFNIYDSNGENIFLGQNLRKRGFFY
jgi:hypothetical protein